MWKTPIIAIVIVELVQGKQQIVKINTDFHLAYSPHIETNARQVWWLVLTCTHDHGQQHCTVGHATNSAISVSHVSYRFTKYF